MMGIGYTLGYTALTLTKDIQTGSLIIFVSILTYVIIQKSVRRFMNFVAGNNKKQSLHIVVRVMRMMCLL